jgi:hypothetical protein
MLYCGYFMYLHSMKYLLLPAALLLTLLIGTTHAQTEETTWFAKPLNNTKGIAAQVGQKLAVCDTVYDFRVVNQATVLLNLGGRYPNQSLTVTVKGSNVKINPALMKGKLVCFYGEITLFKSKPELVVTEPAQIMNIKSYQ